MEKVREALRSFSGIQRRFEFKGDVSGVRVFDDYGHHPTEIAATVGTAKETVKQNSASPGNRGRLFVLFQPHRYTRTRDLLYDFFGVLSEADRVILMDIYPAGERELSGINSRVLSEGMKESGTDVVYIKRKEEILHYLREELKSGDTLLTLGAGNVWEFGEEFIKLKNKESKVKGKGRYFL